jgi:flagellar basal-body rod modification protein FlgD
MTSSIQNSGSTTGTSGVTNTSSTSSVVDPNSAAAMQTQFLTMLTAQLQNQDPTNPMDESAITTQMAELSTVSGIAQLNSTLSALSSSMVLGQSTSLIGQNVLVPGSSLSLSNGQAVGGVNLSQSADDVKVTISDSSGNVVNTIDLGSQSAGGIVPFTWNGTTSTGATAPNGNYTFTATATLGTAVSTPTTLSYGQVNGVTPSASGVSVNVGSLGAIPLSSVAMVL